MAPLPKLKVTAAPSFDEAAVRAHCEMLHSLAKGVDGILVVSTFYANAGDRPGPITHHPVGDVDGMIEAVMAHADTAGVNVYTGLHVMRRGLERGKRGTERDIVASLGVVADLDGDTGKTGDLPVDPDFVVETSPGNFQPAIIFDTPATPAEAREIGAALRAATGADHGTVDPAHVWRIPGTLNWPSATKLARGRSPEPVPVIVAAPYAGTVQRVADLKAALAPWAGETNLQVKPLSLGDLPCPDDIEVSDTAAELLAANDVGDRSAHAARVVERLAYDGHTAEEAAALFLAASGDWLERYPTEARARADFERLHSRFALPMMEKREEEATSGRRLVDGLLKKHALKAANDNKAPAAGLDIYDWTVDRFVGDPPPVEYLVDGVIPLGVPGMVSAMGDTGKSFALLELHRRVAFGQGTFAPDVFGGKVAAMGTSVMITSEDDAGEVHRRIAALDQKGERFGPDGRKMIVVPLPSAGGAMAFWREDKKSGLIETEEFKRIRDQLRKIDDLRLVTFDPLASFAHLPLNEDPAAGQFVCTSLSRLATETGATVLVAHHMRKTQKPIENLGDARDAIRGSTALVDGLRLAYALWPADEARGKRVCKSLGEEYATNRVVLGGVVKANGPAKRIVSTLVRNSHGLLVDKTAALGATAPDQGDLRAALVVAVEAAAASGQPFTKTGSTGLYAMRERLPAELRGLSRHRIEGLAAGAIESGDIQLCLASGTTAKWLDVPGGHFSMGLGEFRKGATR